MAKKDAWQNIRVEMARKLSRIPEVSHGAFRLWWELAFNWCWTDPECYPHQQVVAVALGVHSNTAGLWAKELEDVGLLTRSKRGRGYRYTLSTTVPDALTAEDWRFNNAKITQRVRGTPARNPMMTPLDTHEISGCDDEVSDDSPTKSGGVYPRNQGVSQDSPPKSVGEHPRNPGLYRSTSKMKADEREKKSDEGEESGARNAHQTNDSVEESGGVESAKAHTPREESTYDDEESQVEDPSELMEDPPVPRKQPKKARRKKRAPGLAGMAPAGKGLHNASRPRRGTKVNSAEDPPVWKPEDVLSLLRGEAELKYGSKCLRAYDADLTAAQKGMLRKALLDVMAPDLVMSLIRVLVWDWEIARATCFPYRPQVKYPSVEALVQYRETLTSNVDSGFEYTGAVRGKQDTYASKYLNQQPTAPVYEDPWDLG